MSKLFAAYLHTLRWNCVTATDPRLFQAPFRAGIRIEPYQLEPLRKALLLPRVNLFIADDVGLGKTIEAGLIARELLLRKKVRDIIVACPPSMLLQWKEELETRFGLTFVILDRDYIADVRQERGYGVNPWTTHTRFLVSNRLLVDEAYATPLRDWLGDLSPKGLRESAGLMVNYLYRLEDIEKNHEAYANQGEIAASSAVKKLLKNEGRRLLDMRLS